MPFSKSGRAFDPILAISGSLLLDFSDTGISPFHRGGNKCVFEGVFHRSVNRQPNSSTYQRGSGLVWSVIKRLIWSAFPASLWTPI